jgi:hypothetical protein
MVFHWIVERAANLVQLQKRQKTTDLCPMSLEVRLSLSSSSFVWVRVCQCKVQFHMEKRDMFHIKDEWFFCVVSKAVFLPGATKSRSIHSQFLCKKNYCLNCLFFLSKILNCNALWISQNIIKLPFVATYSSSSGSWFDIREGCNSLLILSQLVSKLFSSCLKYYTQILYQNTARRAGGYIGRQNEQWNRMRTMVFFFSYAEIQRMYFRREAISTLASQ